MNKITERKDLLLNTLEFLSHVTCALTVDLMDIIISCSKGSPCGSGKAFFKRRDERHDAIEKFRSDLQEQKRLYNLIYRLKCDGLVELTKKDGSKFLLLTPKGRQKLDFLKKASPPKQSYTIEAGKVLKIIVFDIPEVERGKRLWLIRALRNLNFAMLQKSVWIGKNKLPESFIKDLNRLRLLRYIRIFSVKETGNIKD